MRKMLREGHRRSPRLSALNANKAQPSRSPFAQTTSSHVNNHQKKRRRFSAGAGPVSAIRDKKKRKLKPLQDVDSVANVEHDPKSIDKHDGREASLEELLINDRPILLEKDGQKHKDQDTNRGQPPVVQSASWMPEKRILELILDVLQRRDTHEIFAEPVDLEVEDYYEIIKEPMDFGTMRAKLHEGMYNNLEQFEHDVFLIFRNAMHFNSSSTIYFRQARAIDELANKVFQVLKTDPENFESEFLGKRRATNRGPKCEAKSSVYSSSYKLANNSRLNYGRHIASRAPVLGSASSMSNLRTAVRPILLCSSSGITTQSDLRDDEVPFGGGDGRGCSSSEADRRSTYTSSLSVVHDPSIVSTMYSNSKLLMHMNQQGSSYRESLMLFAKDLGPTAQMIARRKLYGWSTEAANYMNSGSNWLKAPTCKNYATSSRGQWMSTGIAAKSQNLLDGYAIDIHDDDNRGTAYSCEKMGFSGTSREVSPGYVRSTLGAIRQEARTRDDMEAGVVSTGDNFLQNQKTVTQIGSHSSVKNGRNLNFSVEWLNKEKKSAILSMEKSKVDDELQPLDSAILECRETDNYSFPLSSWASGMAADGKSGFGQISGFTNNLASAYMRDCDQAVTGCGVISGHGSSAETEWTSKSSQTLTPVSRFMFDLPFLKARLDQISSSEQVRYVQQNSGGQATFLDKISETCHDNHTHLAY